LIGERAEGESGLQGEALSTVVVGGAAVRDSDALVGNGAPGEGGVSAGAVSALVVIVGASDGD
jgi:hypothetical protein